MSKIKKVDWKDVLFRALKTFAEAFLSSFSIVTFTGIADFDGLRTALFSALTAAVAAGVSAVWNMALGMLKKGDT